MILRQGDWQFRVDVEQTMDYTYQCSLDHCTCPYCQNFYENADRAHPSLRPVLSRFGICFDGPCEVMPFEPDLVAAAYRVTGEITVKGKEQLHADGVDIRPENSDENTFLLWVGPMELPWTQDVDMDEVISPANQPEFLDRMMSQALRWAETDTPES